MLFRIGNTTTYLKYNKETFRFVDSKSNPLCKHEYNNKTKDLINWINNNNDKSGISLCIRCNAERLINKALSNNVKRTIGYSIKPFEDDPIAKIQPNLVKGPEILYKKLWNSFSNIENLMEQKEKTSALDIYDILILGDIPIFEAELCPVDGDKNNKLFYIKVMKDSLGSGVYGEVNTVSNKDSPLYKDMSFELICKKSKIIDTDFLDVITSLSSFWEEKTQQQEEEGKFINKNAFIQHTLNKKTGKTRYVFGKSVDTYELKQKDGNYYLPRKDAINIFSKYFSIEKTNNGIEIIIYENYLADRSGFKQETKKNTGAFINEIIVSSIVDNYRRNNIIPHFPLFLGWFGCKPKKDPSSSRTVGDAYIISEKLQYPLEDFVNNELFKIPADKDEDKYRKNFDDSKSIVISLLFQGMYTLAFMLYGMREKGMIHNDLHLGNVMVTKIDDRYKNMEYLVYEVNGKSFYLKNCGYKLVFIDFGLTRFYSDGCGFKLNVSRELLNHRIIDADDDDNEEKIIYSYKSDDDLGVVDHLVLTKNDESQSGRDSLPFLTNLLGLVYQKMTMVENRDDRNNIQFSDLDDYYQNNEALYMISRTVNELIDNSFGEEIQKPDYAEDYEGEASELLKEIYSLGPSENDDGISNQNCEEKYNKLMHLYNNYQVNLFNFNVDPLSLFTSNGTKSARTFYHNRYFTKAPKDSTPLNTIVVSKIDTRK